MDGIFLCDRCSTPLINRESKLFCDDCKESFATVEDNVACFNGVPEIDGYFEKFTNTMATFYEGYNRDKFLASFQKSEYWEMDLQSKGVGVTKKYWWEKHLGKLENKTILDLGCGVTYLPPYWAETNNKVVAMDVCKDEVLLLRKVMDMVEIPLDRFFLAVGDAEKVKFDKKFDIINMCNALHHLPDREAVMSRVREWLKDDGKLVIEEANYYWPPRWIVETTIIQPNPIHDYFLRNDKVEEGERGITYSELKNLLTKHGFKIEYSEVDTNYFGYFLYHFVKKQTMLTRLVYEFDKHVLARFLPDLLAPFEYVVASKVN